MRSHHLLAVFTMVIALAGCSTSNPETTSSRSTAPVEEDSAITFGEAPVDNLCGDTMRAAAVTGRAGGNTDQLVTATAACAAPIYWVNAAREYPEALDLTDPTDEAIARSYYAICVAAKKSNVIGSCDSDEAEKLFTALSERL
ncbi:hypothetical protein [Rathayibacter sp. PhB127]|uniref:hypothetical protein n=1 Tax=Rathayibacter sp. PhB127 TaxID=2485176 RepID=UPI001C855F59|nr:hypothetical protein [Rathayibacter sp. PhB127]